MTNRRMHNPARQEDSGHDPHHPAVPARAHDGTGGYHPHESPMVMLVPLIVLSVGAVFAGAVFSHAFLESADFWNGSLFYNEHLMHAMHEVPAWVKIAPGIVMLIGLAIAWNNYIRDTSAPARFVSQFGFLYRFLKNKWYFDELYHAVFVRPAFWLGRKFWTIGDIGIIDRFGPNGAASVVAASSRFASKVQTGYLYSYALIMLLGLVAAVSWIIATMAGQ